MPKPMFVWSGSAWVSVASEVESLAGFATQSYADNVPGSKLIVPSSISVGSGSGSVNSNGTITISNSSSLTANGVFSSTYKTYKILVSNTTATALTNCYLQFTSSGTPDTNTAYHWLRLAIANASVAGAAVASQAQWILGRIDTTKSQIESIVSNPNVAETKSYMGVGGGRSNSALFTGDFSNSTSFDGFKLFFDSTTTISGTISILGYKN